MIPSAIARCAAGTVGVTFAICSRQEMLGMRLAVMHNLYFYNNLMAEIRQALDNGSFAQYKSEYCVKLDTRI